LNEYGDTRGLINSTRVSSTKPSPTPATTGGIAAAEGGQLAAGDHSVGVQLIAQEAKAWARMGRPREMEAAVERGRLALEDMPYPDKTVM
jgi:hypothetical protein